MYTLYSICACMHCIPLQPTRTPLSPRNDAESTEDGLLPSTAHIVHLKGGDGLRHNTSWARRWDGHCPYLSFPDM